MSGTERAGGLEALQREWRERAQDMNCQLHSGPGYTAHIPKHCPFCTITDCADALAPHIAREQRLVASVRAFIAWADDCWDSWAINDETTPQAKAEYAAAKELIADIDAQGRGA